MSRYDPAFQIMNIHPRRYLLVYAAPMVGAGLIAALLVLFAFGGLLPVWLRFTLPPGLLLFAVAGAASYPLTVVDRKKTEIEDALPFFMTHFGVLSTSNIPRTEVFRTLADKKEYRFLAEELRRIHGLVTDWKMALPEACRFASLSTPSTIFGDFLERLAHAMETGQDLEQFLTGEQSVMMKEYSTVYETSIYQIEAWKDMYMSAMMSGAFFVIFAIITPILSGGNPETLLMGVLAFVLFMEVILLFVLKMRTPSDKLFHSLPIMTDERARMRRILAISGGATFVIFPVLYFFVPIPTAAAIAISVAPLAFIGVMSRRVEAAVRRREDNYAAFIRSLGASLAARGGSLREVMAVVKAHNFGPLTELVDRLYARLTWRLDDTGAWKYFSAESGSYLIDSFTDMFIEGVQSGGKPDKVGDIISQNVVGILNLRSSRYATAGTFRGMVMGLTASMAFVMFIGVGILGTLGDIFETTAGTDPELAPIQVEFDVDLDLINDMVLGLIAIHCFLAAWMLKLVDGGSLPAGLAGLVIMIWIAVGLATLSSEIMPRLFNVTSGT